jgi:hypothetical protein
MEILDGGNGAAAPVVLETWECYGCFLQNTDYGDLNYTTNEPATVALTIAYDNAMHTPDAVGVVGIGTAGTARSAASSSAVGSSGI